MKTPATLIAIVLIGAVGGGGYWLGSRSGSAAHAPADAQSPAAAAPQPRKLLYYRNPMGLADTSPVPKKDPMGMDYIAVYEGEEAAGPAAAAGQVRIGAEMIQKLGVRTEPAGMRQLHRTIRAAGRIEADERRIFAVTAKFEGYVERLHVNATGQPVAKGQPLFEAYSPDLLAAQREYAIALQGLEAMKAAGAEAQAGMRQLADSSLARLRNWDLSAPQVAALMQSGQPQRTVSFPSPVAGIVSEKKAVQGMRFMAGDLLYQVTDLSSVWVIADVAEQDIALVRPGARARITTTAHPNAGLEGRVTFVYPMLNAETRSIPVRVELANPGLRLKPAMFAQVELGVGGKTPVLAVPDSAIIDSGTRRIVLVQVGEGRFEPREVELGQRAQAYVEVLEGVREGEPVVVAANFLIDAESNLKAALARLGGPAASGAAPPAAVVGHRADGTVEDIDAASGTLILHHEPIASLKWPAMTMEFKAANASLLKGLKPGHAVRFEFVERQPGEYVVTSISARAAAPKPAAPPQPGAGRATHSGH